MIPKYTIWLDGKPYCGEVRRVEPARPTVGMGWSGKQPELRNVQYIGIAGRDDPLEIQGRTNLRSYLTRILDRLGDGLEAKEITIKLCQ